MTSCLIRIGHIETLDGKIGQMEAEVGLVRHEFGYLGPICMIWTQKSCTESDGYGNVIFQLYLESACMHVQCYMMMATLKVFLSNFFWKVVGGS